MDKSKHYSSKLNVQVRYSHSAAILAVPSIQHAVVTGTHTNPGLEESGSVRNAMLKLERRHHREAVYRALILITGHITTQQLSKK